MLTKISRKSFISRKQNEAQNQSDSEEDRGLSSLVLRVCCAWNVPFQIDPARGIGTIS